MEPLKIYISHSAQDNDFAERLATALRSAETSVIFDRRVNDASIPGDAMWEPLSTCSVFALVLSPAALASKWVSKEREVIQRQREEFMENFTKAMSPDARKHHMQPLWFLKEGWQRCIVVLLAEQLNSPLSLDELTSLGPLKVIASSELRPLPADERGQRAREMIFSFTRTGRLRRILDRLAPDDIARVMRNAQSGGYSMDATVARLLTERAQAAPLTISDSSTDLEPAQAPTPAPESGPYAVWCPVANVVEEQHYGPGGQEIRRGTKHFPPGAKVYCLPTLWGDGYDNITVIGRHRGSHRYVKMVIPSKRLTNWRADLVYSPHVMRDLEGYWDGTAASKQRAQAIVDMCREREARHHSEASE